MSETHELPLMKKAMIQAAGVLLSSPALYRAALPAADSALRHLPRFIVYNRLNTFAAESMFEYGSRVGFWRVARLLSERGTAATIFGCAVALERHPEVAAAIRQLGYDICCHGYRWSVISHSLWSASVRGSPLRSRVSSEPVASVRAVGIVAMVPV
jgi:hypothetical protein